MDITCPLDGCVNTVYKFMVNETVKYAGLSGHRPKHWAVNTAITGMWETIQEIQSLKAENKRNAMRVTGESSMLFVSW